MEEIKEEVKEEIKEEVKEEIKEVPKVSNLGAHIRNFRIRQNRTLQDVSHSCGLSKSMLSKVENDKAIPSVAALVKIASSLGVTVSDILEADETLSADFTSCLEAFENVTHTQKGYAIFPFASKFHKKKIQPFLFIAKKGEVKQHKVTHEGEEFIYMLKGEMKLKIGAVEYSLKEGDSMYFNSLEPHGITPVSDEVFYLDIFA